MLATILSALFVIALTIAYYKDYKDHLKIWGKKDYKLLYLFVLGTIAVVVLKKIFF